MSTLSTVLSLIFFFEFLFYSFLSFFTSEFKMELQGHRGFGKLASFNSIRGFHLAGLINSTDSKPVNPARWNPRIELKGASLPNPRCPCSSIFYSEVKKGEPEKGKGYCKIKFDFYASVITDKHWCLILHGLNQIKNSGEGEQIFRLHSGQIF